MKRLALTLTLAAGIAVATAAPAYAASTCTLGSCMAVLATCHGDIAVCPICIDWERPLNVEACSP